MSRTVTLTQLLADIRWQADQVGATVRHEDAPLTRIINQSIQRFRERITVSGDTFYLTSATATISSGQASTTQAYQTLDISGFSPEPVRTFGVDILYQSRVVSLVHVPFDDRNDFGGGVDTGPPRAFAHYQAQTLAIFPVPDGSYTARVYYCPVATNLSSGSDTFDGVAGWEEYLTWDCVCRVIIRDQYPQAAAIANQYRLETWSDIVKTAGRASHSGGAVLGRDTMGERYSVQSRSRQLPPP